MLPGKLRGRFARKFILFIYLVSGTYLKLISLEFTLSEHITLL